MKIEQDGSEAFTLDDGRTVSGRRFRVTDGERTGVFYMDSRLYDIARPDWLRNEERALAERALDKLFVSSEPRMRIEPLQ